MDNNKKVTIGAIVATDYRTADVFRKYGIDFCCNGNRSIDDACKEGNLDATLIENDLQALTVSGGSQESAIDFKSWPFDLLADYIEKKHHRYVATQIPVLQAYLLKITSVHGGRHPELQEIKELFDGSAEELTAHMKKEEMLLFPFIRKMVTTKHDNLNSLEAPFGTVQNPIRMMMHEHDTEGVRFRKIAALTNNYQVPADGCNTYLVTYKLLKEFEEDLHLHIHLENNILFPKAIEMEQALMQ
jgi:regulator of cell morphogenesis and NO signaling